MHFEVVRIMFYESEIIWTVIYTMLQIVFIGFLGSDVICIWSPVTGMTRNMSN